MCTNRSGIQKFFVLPIECMYVFWMYLRPSSNSFPAKQWSSNSKGKAVGKDNLRCWKGVGLMYRQRQKCYYRYKEVVLVDSIKLIVLKQNKLHVCFPAYWQINLNSQYIQSILPKKKSVVFILLHNSYLHMKQRFCLRNLEYRNTASTKHIKLSHPELRI